MGPGSWRSLLPEQMRETLACCMRGAGACENFIYVGRGIAKLKHGSVPRDLAYLALDYRSVSGGTYFSHIHPMEQVYIYIYTLYPSMQPDYILLSPLLIQKGDDGGVLYGKSTIGACDVAIGASTNRVRKASLDF